MARRYGPPVGSKHSRVSVELRFVVHCQPNSRGHTKAWEM